MSEQDKKARLRFMDEFDKVVCGGQNTSVTARAKFLASLFGTSGATVQAAVYMGKDLVNDEVAILHQELQKPKVQKKITEEGNEAFLDPALWLPTEERAAWRKAVKAGEELPSGGRGKRKGGRRKATEKGAKNSETQALATVPTDETRQPASNKVAEIAETRTVERRPVEDDSPNIILQSANGALLKLMLKKGTSLKIHSTPEGGWAAQLDG